MDAALVIAFAVGASLVIVALGAAAALIIKSFREVHGHEEEETQTPPDVATSLDEDLVALRTVKFGRTMAPIPRTIPERFKKG